MPNYIVRPYFGHDCNSWDGFNNGHYLDAIQVTADSPEEASCLAEDLFRAENPRLVLRESEDSSDLFHDGLDWVNAYVDSDGNYITYEQWMELNDGDAEVGGYTYQFVNFYDVTEA